MEYAQFNAMKPSPTAKSIFIPCLNSKTLLNLPICFWPGYNKTHLAIAMLSILNSKWRIKYLTNKLICIDSNGQRNFTVNPKLCVTWLLHIYNCPSARILSPLDTLMQTFGPCICRLSDQPCCQWSEMQKVNVFFAIAFQLRWGHMVMTPCEFGLGAQIK